MDIILHTIDAAYLLQPATHEGLSSGVLQRPLASVSVSENKVVIPSFLNMMGLILGSSGLCGREN